MRLNSPVVLGRGDVLLKFPELLDEYDPALLPPQPYVAVHMFGCTNARVLPKFGLLLAGLLQAKVRFVLVGSETQDDLPPIFRLHIDVVKRARKFIGTRSVFNCVAQIMEIPSFVLVDRSQHDPLIERYMQANMAIVREWNVGTPIETLYREAVEWARD